jgi:hypothetical protein
MFEQSTTAPVQPVGDPSCNNCHSYQLGDNGRGEFVCFNCGRVNGVVFADTPEIAYYKAKTYQRTFYFNERCSRWLCDEPRINADAWNVIYSAAKQYLENRRHITRITRQTVNKILRSVDLTEDFKKRHQSKKFKCTLMSKKRFYDKYSEKWKQIIWKLTGRRPVMPTQPLVDKIKFLFLACQKPFDIFRHAPNCDKRFRCDQYFDCWHNFINYDFVFRKLLQVCELHFGFKDVFKLHKDEFILVSAKVRNTKLRPMWKKICEFNHWPCPDDE